MIDTQTHGEANQNRPIRHHAVKAAKFAGMILVLAVLVHVSWNMFAPDMLGLEAIRMKQALGLVVFVGVFAFLLRFGRGRISPTTAS